MTPPAGDTVLLIRKAVIEAEKLSRYYGCLARRLTKTSELLDIAVIVASLAGAATISSSLPRWVPVLILSIAAATCMFKVFGRYEHQAACSGILCSQMQELATKWLDLWANVHLREDKELREAWLNLMRRQRTVQLHAPAELPLSNRLMLRSRREAERFWSLHQEAEATTVAERPDLSEKAKARGESAHAAAMLDE